MLRVMLACVLLLSTMMINMSMADSSSSGEIQECSEQLAGMATCLPYVGGQAKSPTPDCCSGMKQVLKDHKKCLCVIVKDRNDPMIGTLQINVTLALSLPTVCNAPANVSKCPELLHMDPKSPEAQIFYQFDKNTTKSASSPSHSPTSTAGSSGGNGTSSRETSSSQKNQAFCNMENIIGLDILVIGLLFWALIGPNTPPLGL